MSKKRRSQKKSIQRRRKVKHRQQIRRREEHARSVVGAAEARFESLCGIRVRRGAPPGVPKASETLSRFAEPLTDLIDPDAFDDDEYLERMGLVLAGAAVIWNLAYVAATDDDPPPSIRSTFLPTPLEETYARLARVIGRDLEEIERVVWEEVLEQWPELASAYRGMLLPGVEVSFVPSGELYIVASGMRFG